MGGDKVLIIKTGYCELLDKTNNSRRVSLGDILRITPILHAFKEDKITWVSDQSAFPLLEQNPLISRLLHYDFTTTNQIGSEEFDFVINLEKVPGICAIADKIYTRKKKFGFGFDPKTGDAKALDRTFEVLAVNADPKWKKSNLKTSQELLFEMIGKKWSGEDYVLGYKPNTKKVYDVGLNIIVGTKWPNKSWPLHKWDNLERRLRKDNLTVTRQDKAGQDILTDLYKYMDWINSCEIVVSNDSLGLHLALALQKKTIGLFGPTSHKEFEFYGRGTAIYPSGKQECIPCFQSYCTANVFCMDQISVEEVYKEVINYRER